MAVPCAELLARARRFQATLPDGAFPTVDNRLAELAELPGYAAEIEAHAAGVRPLLHRATVTLLDEFLQFKRAYGSSVERELYCTVVADRAALVDRLLQKRPLVFYLPSDTYLLRTGQFGAGGFTEIGTAQERAPLLLRDYMSYDEMQLAALVSVSVPTHFINQGDRRNMARLARTDRPHERRGIMVGHVGARFERPQLMEWQHMVVTRAQNTAAQGYGDHASADSVETRRLRPWARFYHQRFGPAGDYGFASYEQATQDSSGRYIRLDGETLFDRTVFALRMRAVIEPLLLEADARGQQAGAGVYLVATGLGLGVWRLCEQQVGDLVAVYAMLLQSLPLPNLRVLEMNWFGESGDGGLQHGESVRTAAGNQVEIRFTRSRAPAAQLVDDDAGLLLVCTYAWDSNSYPGNEYWLGALSASGDPAAACCSTIGELQNPQVNPERLCGTAAWFLGANSLSDAPAASLCPYAELPAAASAAAAAATAAVGDGSDGGDDDGGGRGPRATAAASKASLSV